MIPPLKTGAVPETRGGQPASETAGERAGGLSAHPLPPRPPYPPQDSSCRYTPQGSCHSHTPPPAVGEGADCHSGGQAGPAGPGGQGKEGAVVADPDPGTGAGTGNRWLIREPVPDPGSGAVFSPRDLPEWEKKSGSGSGMNNPDFSF